MKYVSKSSNLRIVLEPGIPANQMAGVPGKTGLYIKFRDGIFETDDEKIIEKIETHPAFGSDFIKIEKNESDPYQEFREESEPIHIHQDIKYGYAEGKKLSRSNFKIDPKLKKLVDEMAISKAKELLPSMVEETIKTMMDRKDKEEESKRLQSVSEEKEEILDDVSEVVEAMKNVEVEEKTAKKSAKKVVKEKK